ncbi:hypothetical protein BDQ17DRAFT_1333156 [Cyathus striatus]|nr:hypothetical protein BDQ17DRAFT_1333156 [Cyathus striatus]
MVMISVTVIFTVLTAHELQSFVYYSPLLHTCSIKDTYNMKTLAVALGSMSMFDLFIVVMVTFNVLDQLRRNHVKVLHVLQCDGFRMFMGLFILHLANLMMVLLGDEVLYGHYAQLQTQDFTYV